MSQMSISVSSPVDSVSRDTEMNKETINQKLKCIKANIKGYPDFPKPGVLFRDILPILSDPPLFNDVISIMAEHIKHLDTKIDAIIGLESRGFLFGTPLSLKLNIPFVPIRKKGKLPGTTEKAHFTLEYGTDTIEIQKDALKPGASVIIVDDLLATGGTMEASCKLIEAVGAKVADTVVVIELVDLKGRERLKVPFHSLVQF